MSIANRIFFGFSVTTLLLLVLGVFSIVQIGDVRQNTESIVERDLAFVQQIHAIRDAKHRMQIAAEEVFIAEGLGQRGPDAGDRRREWASATDQVADGLDQASNLAAEYERTALSQDRARSWSQIGQAMRAAKPVFATIRARNEEMFGALEAGNVQAAADDRAGLEASRDAFNLGLERAEAGMTEAIKAGQARVVQVYETSRLLTGLGVVASVVIAVLVAFVIRRSIVGPLGAFMTFVDRVGQGDLTGRTADTNKDEIGQ
ncbi:MAG: MCP four helix bundle domain-containing protein, partial [Phenylobacterium sp.]|nr:MCP four helix bundle domain-containing protein [Phenylobacterium sp.]